MRHNVKKIIFRLIMVLILAVLTAATFFPFYFMIISSLKNNAEIAATVFTPSLPLRFGNYAEATGKVLKYMKNSLIVTGITVVLTVCCGCTSAYIFAKFSFPFKEKIYMFLLMFLMIPGTLTLIPSFVLVNRLGLMGTFWAAILPGVSTAQISFILILRSFIEGLPQDLFDSARIDGAGHLKIFWYVCLPLTKATVFSLALMAFLNSWNDFLWPLLTLSSDDKMKTITLGLYAFGDAQQVAYGPMFAGFVIASIPLTLLFSFNMKYFIAGITSGAVKG